MSARPFARRLPTIPGLSLLGSLLIIAPAAGQSLNLADLLPDLLIDGISLAPPSTGTNHSAHFTTGAEDSENLQFVAVTQMNAEIARQLSSFPLSSSAGSFSYEFNPALGVLTRPTESFGAVYSERPFTVGKGKYNLGVGFSQFSYDKIDDLGLREGDIELVFLHADPGLNGNLIPFFEGDLVTVQLFVDLDVNVTTISATYGVGDRFDMGLVIPIVDVSLDVATAATVLPIATADNTHQFSNGTTKKTTRRGGTAQGVGDISLRALWLPSAFGPNDFRTGITGEIRFPTGDERNLLGTGGLQLKGAMLFSKPHGDMNLHAVAGISFGTDDLPFEIDYTAGVDWSVDSKLTLAFDLLGRRFGEQAEISTNDTTYDYNTATDGSVSLASVDLPTLTISGEDTSVSEYSASFGFKLNVWDTFLLSANGLLPLNDTGLRDDFSTLFGVDYSF